MAMSSGRSTLRPVRRGHPAGGLRDPEHSGATVRFNYVNLFGVLVSVALVSSSGVSTATSTSNGIASTNSASTNRPSSKKRDRSIQGYRTDLDQSRDQFTQVRDRLQETEASLAAARRDLDRLGQERDQLRTSVTNWAAAVAARDEHLEAAASQLRQLGADRNEAVNRSTSWRSNTMRSWKNSTTARNSKPHGVVAYNRGGPARRTAVPLALTISMPFAKPSTS